MDDREHRGRIRGILDVLIAGVLLGDALLDERREARVDTPTGSRIEHEDRAADVDIVVGGQPGLLRRAQRGNDLARRDLGQSPWGRCRDFSPVAILDR